MCSTYTTMAACPGEGKDEVQDQAGYMRVAASITRLFLLFSLFKLYFYTTQEAHELGWTNNKVKKLICLTQKQKRNGEFKKNRGRGDCDVRCLAISLYGGFGYIGVLRD